MFKRIRFYIWERRHPVGKSRHLKDYEEIGAMHSIEPRRVYQLAHGRRSENRTESRVVDELIRREIIKSNHI